MGLGNEEVEIGNRLEDTATETLCGTCGDPETLAETGGLAGILGHFWGHCLVYICTKFILELRFMEIYGG